MLSRSFKSRLQCRKQRNDSKISIDLKQRTKSRDQTEPASAKINGKHLQSVVGVQSYRHRANSTNVDSSPYALKALFCNWVAQFIFQGCSVLFVAPATLRTAITGPIWKANSFTWDAFNRGARLQPPTLEKLSANQRTGERAACGRAAPKAHDRVWHMSVLQHDVNIACIDHLQ